MTNPAWQNEADEAEIKRLQSELTALKAENEKLRAALTIEDKEIFSAAYDYVETTGDNAIIAKYEAFKAGANWRRQILASSEGDKEGWGKPIPYHDEDMK